MYTCTGQVCTHACTKVRRNIRSNAGTGGREEIVQFGGSCQYYACVMRLPVAIASCNCQLQVVMSAPKQ